MVYYDGHLETNLKAMRDMVQKDWDFVFLIDGPEGSGKSVLGMQVASFLDPSYNLSRCCFSAKQFVKAVTSAEKFQAVVFDEALRGLSSRSTLSKVNKALVRMLAEIRQKNLFVIIILPSFFDIDRNIALWRSVALLHVYVGDNLERGRFAFYDYDQKKKLHILGKKMYDYKCVKSTFYGRFTNTYTVDEQEYRNLKLKNLQEQDSEGEDTYKFQDQLRSLMKYCREEKHMTYVEIANGVNKYSGLSISGDAISVALKRYKGDGLA